jgi:flagellar biosynthetic protein FliR
MIDLTPVLRLGLLIVRPSLLIGMAPVFGGAFAPARVKLGLIVLVAITLVPTAIVQPSVDALPIALVVAREATIGFALALAMRCLVGGAEFGGQLIGMQMGLSYGATVDPMSGVRNPVLAVLYSNITIITFFMINGHHAFLRALHQSYRDLPIGTGHIAASLPVDVARLLGVVFTLAARLAAPVVVVLVLVEAGLALLARSAPMLNPMSTGHPLRLLVGLVVLGLVVPAVVSLAAGNLTSIVELALQTAAAFR